ncbi:MAG: sugar-binding protein [Armatimonadota bacterium]|nr:hypothetical protein [bacterium]
MKLAKVTLCLISIFVLCASAGLAQEPVKDQVRCYTTWDEAYLYLSFRVDCPDVRGTHTAPNADTVGDDSVSVFIETDGKRSAKITPACFSMTVSAAGGAQYFAGSESGTLDPLAAFTFKYGQNVQGTMNNGDDIDSGYTVEMAIPWSLMKIEKLSLGYKAGFNFVVRRHGDKGGFVTLSPEVKTEADILNPSKWSSLVFANYSFGVATTNWDKVLSAKYLTRAPLINGLIGDREWHMNTSCAIDLPVPEGFVYEAKFPMQRMAMAEYAYNLQGDKRKTAPYNVANADVILAVAKNNDSVPENVGPWASYDRVQWHKDRISAMVAAGVDIVLPSYCGDKASGAGYARKGLDCLVSAIDELRSEGKSYPRIALSLDTETSSCYETIRSFYQRVPAEYRAMTQTGKPNAGRPACIVAVSKLGTTWDANTINSCNEQFEKDFGCSLVWMATDAVPDGSTGFDAVCGLGPEFEKLAQGTSRNASGRVRAELVSSNADWDALVSRNPEWVLCKAVDQLTSAGVAKFKGKHDLHATFLSWNLPSVLASKQFAQADVEIRNDGDQPWRQTDGWALAYRWYKSGRFFAESKVRRPLAMDVAPGETISVNIGIATVNALNVAIPDGSYEIRFELLRMSDNKWSTALGDQPLVVPVTIGKLPEWGASWLSCKMPVMVASGQSYTTIVRVRNDGSETWLKDVTKLRCKLYQVSEYTQDNPTQNAEQVAAKDMFAPLMADCKPGEIAEFKLDLKLVGLDKKPIPSWTQDADWSYQLRFDITNGKQWLSEFGMPTLNRVVDVFDTDYGPRIVDCDIPKPIAPGKTVDARVVIRNGGVQTWDRKRTRIGYHWYKADGSEVLWEGMTTPLKMNVQPGWPIVALVKVKAPDQPGQYVLVWDMMVDDNWLSTGPLSRGGDVLPVSVEVK